ncbi:MAG: AAA family ATPase [Mogibacterium sp.]|nr:AAA family ATPase [Mogibacterium sp.]
MIDGLKSMYNDFYGSGTDKTEKTERMAKDEPEKSPDANASAPAEIETEVVIETELATQTSKEPEKQEEPKEPERSGMDELEELIGLKTVKHDVEELIGLAKVRKMREEKGMKSVPVSLHLVFSGNPGTGKTTVARILAKLYKEIGILSTGQLVETDRSGLVAGYVGQTAIKTQKKIEEAMGGVLFIDEAYTLNQEGENFGQEAIDTILKAMEDHRDEFIVIVAGYTELMKAFVESNPGLRSRFNKFFEFPDYSADELKQIFDLQCSKYQYTLTEEARSAVHEKIEKLEAEKGENFANAREVRNLFERIITNQAARVADLEDVDEEMLTTITADDLSDPEEGEGTTEKTASDECPVDIVEETAENTNAEGDDAEAAEAADIAEDKTDKKTVDADVMEDLKNIRNMGYLD